MRDTWSTQTRDKARSTPRRIRQKRYAKCARMAFTDWSFYRPPCFSFHFYKVAQKGSVGLRFQGKGFSPVMPIESSRNPATASEERAGKTQCVFGMRSSRNSTEQKLPAGSGLHRASVFMDAATQGWYAVGHPIEGAGLKDFLDACVQWGK